MIDINKPGLILTGVVKKYIVLLLFLACGHIFPQTEEVRMMNISYPKGQDMLVGISGSRQELSVKLHRGGMPVAGEKLRFYLAHRPGNRAAVENETVVTDENGVARSGFYIGDKPGDYIVSVFSLTHPEIQPEEIVIRAYRDSWIVFLVLGMLGGLAIFLFGMDFSAEGLQKAAGDRMRNILGKLTNDRFMGVIAGTLTTAAVQSSSATSVMVIGFVSATLMTLTQAIGVIYGANIGTTITVQLIAFNVSEFSPLMLAIGFFMMLTSSKSPTLKFSGQILMGFGFIFFGMGMMSEAMKPLRSIPGFTNMLAGLSDSPAYGVIFAALFTAIIQSSGAVIGISIALAFQGILSLPAAIVISLGANIGTTATAMLGAINASREGKRVALVHLLFNFGGVLLFLPFLDPYTDFVEHISSIMGADEVSRKIANAHMIFNILATAVFLPFVNPLARFVTWLIPEEEKKKEVFSAKYITGEIQSVNISLEQVYRELQRTGKIAASMLREIRKIIRTSSLELAADVSHECEQIFILEKAIKDYLGKLVIKEMTAEESGEAAFYLHFADSLKRLADSVNKDILVVMNRVGGSLQKLDAGQLRELENFQSRIIELFEKTMQSFDERTIAEAEEAGLLYKKLKILAKRNQTGNLEKSLSASATEEVVSVYLDIMDALRNEGSHVHRIIQAILENG